jgi:glycosyltransferase involved in cell wall biosynthesis
VLAQTYVDFEVVVVDDGSTDETAGVVAGFRDPRVRYVRLARNGGAGAARNVGIREARGRFLAFQDSDDEWLPSKLAQQMSAFARGSARLGMVYSDMKLIRRDGSETDFPAPGLLRDRLIDPATRFYQVHNLGIQSAVIKREYVEEVGGFNESLPAFEDMELFIRLSRLCNFRRLREPLVRYYDTQGISHDPRARWAGRRLLLKLYYRELLTDNLRFLFNELRWLNTKRREATRAGREGTPSPSAAAS